jgi:hypothetical protein
LTFVRRIVREREVTEPRLHTEVLEMLSHILTGDVAHIKVKTDERLSTPAELFKLELHQIATVHKSGVERATLFSYSTNEVNFGQRHPATLNHLLAQLAVFRQRFGLGGARETEVAEYGVVHHLSFHTLSIAQKPVPVKYGKPASEGGYPPVSLCETQTAAGSSAGASSVASGAGGTSSSKASRMSV